MQRGIPRLGALEKRVLEQLWAHGPSDVKRMHAAVGRARGLASNTIQSTLERLHRKGLAERSKAGRAFEYRAAVSRGDWVARALDALLDDASGGDRGLLLAAFVDLTERAGAEELDALERLVRVRRRARGGAS